MHVNISIKTDAINDHFTLFTHILKKMLTLLEKKCALILLEVHPTMINYISLQHSKASVLSPKDILCGYTAFF